MRPVHPQGLGDELAHRHARVEAGQGVLKHDLQVLARRLQRPALRLGDVARPGE